MLADYSMYSNRALHLERLNLNFQVRITNCDLHLNVTPYLRQSVRIFRYLRR